jgi:hypothetical protein
MEMLTRIVVFLLAGSAAVAQQFTISTFAGGPL